MPYTSFSITEFWRRWHMSLSSWLRDYLYIPLGGNRGSNAQTYRNLIMVFLLCGLWHGANWTFVLWGAWHGAFLVIERVGLGSALARAAGAGALGLCAARRHGRLGSVSLRGSDGCDRILRQPLRPERLRRNQLRHARRAERARDRRRFVIGCVLAIAPRWPPKWSAPFFVLRAQPTSSSLSRC